MSGFSSWLPKAVVRTATDGFVNVVRGTADERAANKLAREAITRAVTEAMPNAQPDDMQFAVRMVDEHFAPATWLQPDPEFVGTSVIDRLREAIARQLGPLFEPIEEGPSPAERSGLTRSHADFVDALVGQIAFLSAYAPQEAAVLHALHTEWAAAGASSHAPTPEIRYFIFRSFELLAELGAGRTHVLPVDQPRLLPNATLDFWRRIVSLHGRTYRHGEVAPVEFSTTAEYMRVYPHARPPNSEDGLLYYDLVRPCTEADLGRLFAEDPISKALADEGVSADALAVAVVQRQECGDNEYPPVQETLLVRPIWGLLAEFTATGVDRYSLSELSGYVQSTGLHTFQVESEAELERIALPLVPMRAGESIVIPLATIVPPPADSGVPLHDLDWIPLPEGGSVNVGAHRVPVRDVQTWGPALIPTSAVVTSGSQSVTTPLRRFDPRQVYVLDHLWEMGSCPHVFEVAGNGTMRYLGTAFGRRPGLRQRFTVTTSPDVSCVLVAELEPEETFLETVEVDGVAILADVALGMGDVHAIGVTGRQLLSLVGWYQVGPTADVGPSVIRNRLVREFMAKRPNPTALAESGPVSRLSSA